jgi:hypothetical protein
MQRRKLFLTALIPLLLSAFLIACAPGMQLLTRQADPLEVTGNYTLLLYGCHYSSQIENLAILVREDSRYPVEIYDLDTSYKVKKGVPAGQALAEAKAFIRCSSYSVWRDELRKIPDDRGGAIGYEMRPLYYPLDFGSPDVILTSYALKDGRVRAYIRLLPSVEHERDFPPSDADSGTN